MSDCKEFTKLKADAIIKMGHFQRLLMSEANLKIKLCDTPFNYSELVKELLESSPEGIAFKKAIDLLNSTKV